MLTGHFINYTLLVPPQSAFILDSKDSTRCFHVVYVTFLNYHLNVTAKIEARLIFVSLCKSLSALL